MTRKREREKKGDLKSTLAFLIALILMLAVIFTFTTIQDHDEYVFIQTLDEQAQMKYIEHKAELMDRSEDQIESFGKFFWDLFNVPIPFILVILLLIALAPTSAKNWKKEK
ncbi:hypothetical protein KKC87_04470 [Patescibacteria group bacterium]|nr:hypothetical protein [Patescibacteria group bacterium]